MTDRPIDRESPSAERCAQTPRHELIEGAARFLSGHARHRLEFDAPNGLSGVFAWCRDCSHSIHYPFVPAVDPQSREVIPEINWSPEMASHDDYAPAPVSEPKGEGYEMLTVDEFIAKEGNYRPDEPGIYGKLGRAIMQWKRNDDAAVELYRRALSRRSTVTPKEERDGWSGEWCKRCNRRNVIGFNVSEDVWERIVRGRWNVLCPTCFDEEAQAAGIPYSWGELFAASWQTIYPPGYDSDKVAIRSRAPSPSERTARDKGIHDWTHPADDCDEPGCDHITRRTCENAERTIKFLRELLAKRTARLAKADPAWAAQAARNLFRAVGYTDEEIDAIEHESITGEETKP
jgi:hypothetical protein